MTPFEIEILLHYHTCCGDFARSHAPIFKETVQRLVDMGLMHYEAADGRLIQMTDMGHFYVTEGLCKVPLPTFVIPLR
jgi:hypothetical protein